MIISHDRQTLFIGVPKNGSQTARAVLGQIGIDLVGEMGRHPTVPEAIRLAEERFPGEAIVPTAIYAFWRDPVERFCSAVEFHKRCLPNSFIQLFPERFVGIAPHNRWFEPDPEAVDRNMRTLIDSILPIEILAALPPPSIPGTSFRPRGGTRNDTGLRGVGVVAQELAAVVPEAVLAHDDGLLSVAYGNLVGVLIEAVKDLAGKVERLEGRT